MRWILDPNRGNNPVVDAKWETNKKKIYIYIFRREITLTGTKRRVYSPKNFVSKNQIIPVALATLILDN